MNLEKRVKRHVIARPHDFFAIVPPGCETTCIQELSRLSDTIRLQGATCGGVAFSGRLDDLYRANLNLRTATRVLLRLAEFKATHFVQLDHKIGGLPWMLYLPAGCVPAIKASAHRSRLYHTGALAQRVAQRIAGFWTEQGVAWADDASQTLFIRLVNDTVTVSLDSSGESLHRRGLKKHSAQAPLRETLAAAMMQTAGYKPDRPLVDPMCGAGTFSLEAAMMAKNIPPGSRRQFAFMHWPAFRPARWQYQKKQAARGLRTLKRFAIWASDQDAAACERLKACLIENQLDDAVQVSCANFFAWRPKQVTGRKGLVVLNPPYGRRLSDTQPIGLLYERIGERLCSAYRGWSVALVLPDRALAGRVGLPGALHALRHGGLRLFLLVGRIASHKAVDHAQKKYL